MTLDCVVFNKNEIYLPISLKGKVSSDFGLLSKTKFNLEDLYLNIRQCILILMKNNTIWSHKLVLFLLKKEQLYLAKSRLWAPMPLSWAAALPNFRYKLYASLYAWVRTVCALANQSEKRAGREARHVLVRRSTFLSVSKVGNSSTFFEFVVIISKQSAYDLSSSHLGQVYKHARPTCFELAAVA